MPRLARNLAIAAVAACSLLPIGVRAQWYSSYPPGAAAYPYGAPQPYAVEVAPGTYVIHRPASPRRRVARAAPENVRPRHRADPALIEELRKRGGIKRTVINTTKIVRDPPTVIVHRRVVDDPPIVIVRRHIDEEEGPPVRRRREAAIEPPPISKRQRGDTGRVIKAEAEVTILGPDRMTIRLFRKRRGAAATARAD